MKILIVFLVLFLTNSIFGQNIGINVDGSTPDASAILDLKSNDRGFLPPRMATSERDNIVNPATGLMIYNLETGCYDTFNGTSWHSLCPDGAVSANTCPEGMIDFGTFSIEDIVRSDIGYFRAVDTCHSLGSNTRLCRPSEWYIACHSGLVPSMATTSWEWVDDFRKTNYPLLMNGCESFDDGGYVYYSRKFRCCCEH